MEAAFRFIPVLRRELLPRLLDERDDDQDFAHLADLLHHILRYRADECEERLHSSYQAFDPDPVADSLEEVQQEADLERFLDTLHKVMEQAHFRAVPEEELKDALGVRSLFPVHAEVDLDEYDVLRLYGRGVSERDEQVRDWSTLWRWRTRRLELYDRLVLALRLRPDVLVDDGPMRTAGMEPGKIYLKSFKNIPKSDIEMVLPNARLRLRPIDRLLVGGTLAAGVGWTLYQSIGVVLALIAGTFALTLDDPAIRAFGGVLLVLAGYLWRTHSKVKTRRLEYIKTLSKGLYFRNLANNRVVLDQSLRLAQDENEKEALLAYHVLTQGPMTTEELDERTEAWVHQISGQHADFDVHDGLKTLEELGLVEKKEGKWHALDPKEGARIVDAKWDGAFGARPTA